MYYQIKIMTLKELAVDHDYYASDSNYYSNDAGGKYDTWADFYEEFIDAFICIKRLYMRFRSIAHNVLGMPRCEINNKI